MLKIIYILVEIEINILIDKLILITYLYYYYIIYKNVLFTRDIFNILNKYVYTYNK